MEFTNYKLEINTGNVFVSHEENFQKRTIFFISHQSLIDGEKFVESNRDLKETYILRRTKAENNICLSVGKWGTYEGRDENDEAIYGKTVWKNYILGKNKGLAVMQGEEISTVFLDVFDD